jgi:hypothetical protein
MPSVPPHRSDPSTAHTAHPPMSGGGGGGDGDDFGAWATNAPSPLGPPDGRIEGARTGAQILTGPAVRAKVLNAPSFMRLQDRTPQIPPPPPILKTSPASPANRN